MLNRSFSLAPTCSEGVQNGFESGIDCGGSCTLKCDGTACVLDLECVNGYCGYSYCTSEQAEERHRRHPLLISFIAPTCDDKIKNGLEEGVDCGGPCSLLCDDAACVLDTGCKSGNCKRELCQGRFSSMSKATNGVLTVRSL